MVEVIFLGGIDVGASCTALRFGDAWLVVDAGVRMTGEPEQRLPDLAALDGKPVAAILVTHAHADHIGALPLLHEKFPEAPIYATSATIRLMTIMLADALAVMAKRAQEELELPLYDAELVERMLRRLTPLPVDTRLPLPEIPDLVVSLRLAGHIAGAVSVGLEHPQGRVVLSGDISLAPQRTIEGAQPPLVSEPDLLILESTYGGRRHAQRQEEERRLAADVAAVITRGGHVLIPAFALGRAQEVLLILQEAQRRREIPQFPVWVDGLVRRVCFAYSTFPGFLGPAMRQRIVRGQAAFFSEHIQMVSNPSQRMGIVQGQPACIVASSGMLTGGPSAWFAGQLVSHREAAILITGYQDEEAPGRALQEAAAGRRGTLKLGGRTLSLAARVMTYSLSGHADEQELVAWAKQIRPRQVALVHGDDSARQSVAAALQAAGLAVVLSQQGETLRVGQATQGRPLATQGRPLAAQGHAAAIPVAAPPLPARTRQAPPDGPEVLAQALWEGAGRPVEPTIVEVHEAARSWYGAEGTPEEVQAVAALIAADPHRFQPLAALPGFVRLMPPAATRQSTTGALPRLRDGSLILAQINGSLIVPWVCQGVSGGVIAGVGPSRYPVHQPVLLRDLVAWVGQWDVAEGATPDARQRVLDDWLLQSSTQRSHTSARVIAQAMQPGRHYDLDTLLEDVGRPASELPWRLHVARLIALHPRLFQIIPAAQPLQDARWSVRLAPTAQTTLQHHGGQPRPDQNAIQQRIDWHFQGVRELYRRSTDAETGDVVLRFRFPLTAERRFATQIAALRDELPVSVEVAAGDTDQTALLNLIQQHLRPLLQLTGTPSVFHQERRVEVRYGGEPAADALAAALDAIEERSGFRVVCVPAPAPSPRPLPAPSAQPKAAPNPRPAPASTPAPPAPAPRPAPARTPAVSPTIPPPKRRDLFTIGAPATERMERDEAVAQAQDILIGLVVGIDADKNTTTLFVRLPLPYGDMQRHRARLEQVVAVTGWGVRVRPHPQHQALEAAVLAALPAGIELVPPLSITSQKQLIQARYRGSADAAVLARVQGEFERVEGWRLTLLPAEGS
ncbi:MAG: MBL fold metallo-hydrolase [Chloroflexales bacterium]|nr:MBL fold metallo-hydrolase [Chloroflexales bacterium]